MYDIYFKKYTQWPVKYKYKIPVQFNVVQQYLYSSITDVKLDVKLYLNEWTVNICWMKCYKFAKQHPSSSRCF